MYQAVERNKVADLPSVLTWCTRSTATLPGLTLLVLLLLLLLPLLLPPVPLLLLLTLLLQSLLLPAMPPFSSVTVPRPPELLYSQPRPRCERGPPAPSRHLSSSSSCDE